MGLGREVCGVHQKEGKNGNLTPFQLLGRWADEGSLEGRKRWEDWTKVMHGRVQLFWSKGLRALLLANPEELTDEEIVEGQAGPEELVAVIPGEVWDQIRDRPGIATQVPSVADLGGKAVRTRVRGILTRETSLKLRRGHANYGTDPNWEEP